jgi:hypothetical protein
VVFEACLAVPLFDLVGCGVLGEAKDLVVAHSDAWFVLAKQSQPLSMGPLSMRHLISGSRRHCFPRPVSVDGEGRNGGFFKAERGPTSCFVEKIQFEANKH